VANGIAFAAAIAMLRNRHAPHQPSIVDTALRASYQHCQSFVQHLVKARNIRGMKERWQTKDPCLVEMAEDI
jgi:hypothetical protein